MAQSDRTNPSESKWIRPDDGGVERSKKGMYKGYDNYKSSR